MDGNRLQDVFATRLKLLREEKGLSQTELSKELKVSRGSISFYESCERMAGIDFLYKAANYFKCTTDYLLGLNESKNNEHVKKRDLENEEMTKALVRYENIDYRGRHPVYPFLVDVLSVPYFYFSLISIVDYVYYDTDKSEEFKTINIDNGLIDEISSNQRLDFFLLSAQNQIANLCKYLRDERIKKDSDTNAQHNLPKE